MRRIVRLTESDLTRLVRHIIRENEEDNKFPFSITVKPTDKFERFLNEIKNRDGRPAFLNPISKITLKNNGDRFNLVKVATLPFDLSNNEFNGKLVLGMQEFYWLSYKPKNSEIFIHTSRIFGTSEILNDFARENELSSTDRRYASADAYRDAGLIWISQGYCKFDEGFEVGMKDKSGYFEITNVEPFNEN